MKSKLCHLFLVIVLGIGVLSCDKDDDITESSTYISGSWNGVSVAYTGVSHTDYQGTVLTSEFVGVGYDLDFSISFSENPNKLTTAGSYGVALTYTILGQTNVQTVDGLNFTNTGIWTLNENTLYLETPLGDIEATIIELTDMTLELSIFQNEVQEESGAIVTSEVELYYTFERVN